MNYSYEQINLIFINCAFYLGTLDIRVQILNFKHET